MRLERVLEAITKRWVISLEIPNFIMNVLVEYRRGVNEAPFSASILMRTLGRKINST